MHFIVLYEWSDGNHNIHTIRTIHYRNWYEWRVITDITPFVENNESTID